MDLIPNFPVGAYVGTTKFYNIDYVVEIVRDAKDLE